MENVAENQQKEVVWKDKKYVCRKMNMGNKDVFVIEFIQRPLFLSKGIDTQGNSFWVSIPPDSKLSHVIRELGEQIDKLIWK